MTLAPLTAAPAIVQVHVAAALLAAVLGIAQFWGAKGTPLHRTLGTLWLAVMTVVALGSFFIWGIRTWGPFSPIHLLSASTLFGVWGAWRTARSGRIRAHKAIVTAMFLGGIVGAGAFTLLPGRIMHAVVFGQP